MALTGFSSLLFLGIVIIAFVAGCIAAIGFIYMFNLVLPNDEAEGLLADGIVYWSYNFFNDHFVMVPRTEVGGDIQEWFEESGKSGD